MRSVHRHHPRAQCLAVAVLCVVLAGCAQERVVSVVSLPLPNPPAAAMEAPSSLKRLPDKPMSLPAFAGEYSSLQTRYIKLAGRHQSLQKYVRRVRESRRASTTK